MEWVVAARTLWAHRRKLYAACGLVAPLALSALLLAYAMLAGGVSPEADAFRRLGPEFLTFRRLPTFHSPFGGCD